MCLYLDPVGPDPSIILDHLPAYNKAYQDWIDKSSLSKDQKKMLMDTYFQEIDQLVVDFNEGHGLGRWCRKLKFLAAVTITAPFEIIDLERDPNGIEIGKPILLAVEFEPNALGVKFYECEYCGHRNIFKYVNTINMNECKRGKIKKKLCTSNVIAEFVTAFSVLFSFHDYEGLIKKLKNEISNISEQFRRICFHMTEVLSTDITPLKALAEYLGKTIVLISWDGADHHTGGNLWLISEKNIDGGRFAHKRKPTSKCSINLINRGIEVEQHGLVNDDNRHKLYQSLIPEKTFPDSEKKLKLHCRMVTEVDGETNIRCREYGKTQTIGFGIPKYFMVRMSETFKANDTEIFSNQPINVMLPGTSRNIDDDDVSRTQKCTIS